MTTIVSLLSDALSLLTAHLYVCYVISATVFSHQLSLAGSLWNLFRGEFPPAYYLIEHARETECVSRQRDLG